MKDFKEFIKEGIVKKQKPDFSRAQFLRLESEKSYALLMKKIELLRVDDSTANDLVKTCYDLLMELIRAKMLEEGYNASGFGAHEAEVAYFSYLNNNQRDVEFLNQLR